MLAVSNLRRLLTSPHTFTLRTVTGSCGLLNYLYGGCDLGFVRSHGENVTITVIYTRSHAGMSMQTDTLEDVF